MIDEGMFDEFEWEDDEPSPTLVRAEVRILGGLRSHVDDAASERGDGFLQSVLSYVGRASDPSYDDIAGFYAHVSGANDEAEWFWIVRLRSGSFCLVRAGCDYTGFDCSGWVSFESHQTLEDCARAAVDESGYHVDLQGQLLRQLSGDQPYGAEIFNQQHEEEDSEYDPYEVPTWEDPFEESSPY